MTNNVVSEDTERYRKYIEEVEAEDTALRLRADRADYWQSEAKVWRWSFYGASLLAAGLLLVSVYLAFPK